MRLPQYGQCVCVCGGEGGEGVAEVGLQQACAAAEMCGAHLPGEVWLGARGGGWCGKRLSSFLSIDLPSMSTF